MAEERSGKPTSLAARGEVSEYLTQLATLAAGSIVVLGTFAGASGTSDGRGFAVGAIACFTLAVVGAMLARLLMIIAAYLELEEREMDKLGTLWIGSLIVGLSGFGLGVVALAVFAAQSV